MLQHLIIHFSLHHLSSGRLREVISNGKLQTFSTKKWSQSLTRGSKYSDFTGNFWYFGKLVAEEGWSEARLYLNKLYILKRIICIEISVYNGSYVKGASPENFSLTGSYILGSEAKFRRRTSHEPNRMQMRKILCSPLLAYDSAHVKYGV